MSRRKYSGRYPCKETGCREMSSFEFETARERADYERSSLPWACVRHYKASEVLSAESNERVTVLIASRVRSTYRPEEFLDGLFWLPEGSERGGSGFSFGPGYKAFAGDFPEGTRLVIAARIETPNPASTKEI